jgi:hypothetical protein
MLSMYVVAIAGIGKSVFLYFLLWHLARNRATVVYDRRDRDPVLFSPDGVFEGALELFRGHLQHYNTW